MTTPAGSLPDAEEPEVHGPAEVRTALAEHATAETLALFDRQIEQASVLSLAQDDIAPLARALRAWWTAVRVARGAIAPPSSPGDAMEQTIAAWEAKHPGRHLCRTA